MSAGERQGAATLRVERVASFTPDARSLLEAYYEEVRVLLQDGPQEMLALLAEPGSGMWVAYSETSAVGCVVLRGHVPTSEAGECKRLYVRPAFRRHGVAEALMESLEDFARDAGFHWVYLDTKEEFAASVKLYRRRGYEPCERYNRNPQATLFFRKEMV